MDVGSDLQVHALQSFRIFLGVGLLGMMLLVAGTFGMGVYIFMANLWASCRGKRTDWAPLGTVWLMMGPLLLGLGLMGMTYHRIYDKADQVAIQLPDQSMAEASQ